MFANYLEFVFFKKNQSRVLIISFAMYLCLVVGEHIPTQNTLHNYINIGLCAGGNISF